MGKIAVYVIYKHPADYPDKYVMRKFIGNHPTSHFETADTLEEIRKFLPKNTIRFERDISDDKCIVESWV